MRAGARTVIRPVNPVRARRARHLGPSVDDKERPSPRHLAQAERQREQLVVRQVLLAQLHDVHAAHDRRRDDGLQPALSEPPPIGNQAEDGGRQLRPGFSVSLCLRVRYPYRTTPSSGLLALA